MTFYLKHPQDWWFGLAGEKHDSLTCEKDGCFACSAMCHYAGAVKEAFEEAALTAEACIAPVHVYEKKCCGELIAAAIREKAREL